MIKKTCSSCNETKSINEFYKQRKWHFHQCKECKKEYAREYERKKVKEKEQELELEIEQTTLISSVLCTNDFFKPATINGQYYGK